MRHIGLISCTKKKLDTSDFAQNIYQGTSFVSGRAILEELCDRWYVLSARHGLLNPYTRIAPYDMSLDDLSDYDYMNWMQNVERHVASMSPDKVTLIGPDVYVKYLVSALPKYFIEVDRRPRVDIHRSDTGHDTFYMSCELCGNSGPFRMCRDDAVQDAIAHPCRVTTKEVA